MGGLLLWSYKAISNNVESERVDGRGGDNEWVHAHT